MYYHAHLDEAKTDYLYWLHTNSKEESKILQYLNAGSTSKILKKVLKNRLTNIELNFKFYVPMLTKIFDMEESNSYDNLDD